MNLTKILLIFSIMTNCIQFNERWSVFSTPIKVHASKHFCSQKENHLNQFFMRLLKNERNVTVESYMESHEENMKIPRLLRLFEDYFLLLITPKTPIDNFMSKGMTRLKNREVFA